MFKKIFVLFFIVSFIAGCVSNPITQGSFINTELIDFPEVGATETVGLGETLVSKGVRSTGPALELNNRTTFGKEEGEGSLLTCGVTVDRGAYFKIGTYASDPITTECFGPVSAQVTNSDGSTSVLTCAGNYLSGNICRSGPNEYFFLVNFSNQVHELQQQLNQIERVILTVQQSTNYVQELLYNGRVGNNIRFIYREFSDDLIRPAFTQEVQYDLDESSTIGFRDLRIEILSASNTNISYRLIRNF
tara:strand:+ start:29861 stop:30601 length:741 start_codon:yes stop_codon:yes gene_type:complete